MVKMQNFCVVNDIFNNHTYCLTPKNAFFTTSYTMYNHFYRIEIHVHVYFYRNEIHVPVHI